MGKKPFMVKRFILKTTIPCFLRRRPRRRALQQQADPEADAAFYRTTFARLHELPSYPFRPYARVERWLECYYDLPLHLQRLLEPSSSPSGTTPSPDSGANSSKDHVSCARLPHPPAAHTNGLQNPLPGSGNWNADAEWEAETRRRQEEYSASERDEAREGRPRPPVRDPLSAAGIYPIQPALYPVDWDLVLGASRLVHPADAARPRAQHEAGFPPLQRTARRRRWGGSGTWRELSTVGSPNTTSVSGS
ncbi:hypothetical protein P171DRAFT_199132 [Karstenula rhodostoma CBS 690.94]|uniref:Uncharacterized protein n=1 Tax=Karstenula rhodostoma CBS 690.94 TaxID=1392251 RepID=A0A9P4PT65_9PLEO|nr:hypothetical protein P171DRAFT_199132 [Karstenula rhodostoma CBS 690.94]